MSRLVEAREHDEEDAQDDQPPRQRARRHPPDAPQEPSGPGDGTPSLWRPTRNNQNTIQRDPAVPATPSRLLTLINRTGFAVDDRATPEAITEALRLNGHHTYKYDPTLLALEPWTEIMGRPPDRLTWVLEDSGGPSGDTVFPYLTWDLRAPSAASPTIFWHGTRGDQAARLAAAGGHLLPGPRRESAGRRISNQDRTYVGVLPSHAAWYAVPPHPPNSLDDRTLAWGPIALFMCEAQERPGETRTTSCATAATGLVLFTPIPWPS